MKKRLENLQMKWEQILVKMEQKGRTRKCSYRSTGFHDSLQQIWYIS